MRFTVLTLFPDLIRSYVSQGVVGRAVESGLVDVEAVDIRAFATDKYRTVDDVPFGGGAGMVLKAEPVAAALESVGPVDHRIMLAPSGRPFSQQDAVRWSSLDSVVLVCGRYEGIDARIREDFVDDAVSIGDYVLSGGELGALVVLDATLRLVPGVLGNSESPQKESFAEGLLEHPHYTRPAEWRGRAVPDVLLSGHHARIAKWRRQRSLERTWALRRDLISQAVLSPEDTRFLAELTEGQREEET